MPNIAYILSPGKIVGGAEIYTIELAKAIQEHSNYTAYIFYSHNSEMESLLDQNNILNYWLGSTLKESAKRLQQLVDELNIDFIHTSGYHSNFIIQYWVKNASYFRNRISLCCTEHGWINTNYFERLKTKYDLKSLPLFDAVFVDAPYMKQYINDSIGIQNVFFIPVCLSRKYEKYIADSATFRKKKKLVLGIGRLSDEKRFDKFLQVAHNLVKSDPSFQFILAGDGDGRVQLEQYIARHDLSNNISLIGFLDDPREIYAQAEYLLITSVTEGSPLVALEAMVTETIVIASNVGTLETSLSERRGFVYDKEDSPLSIARLIQNVDSMVESDKNSIRAAAKAYVKQNHLIGHTVKMYMAEYKRLMTCK